MGRRVDTRQAKFIEEYTARNFTNAIDAVIAAGYSPASAKKQATNLMRRPTVIEAINRAKEDTLEKAKSSAKKVIEKLWQMAENGEAPHRDRVRALELLGKTHGLFIDRSDNQTTINIPVQVVEQYARDRGIDPVALKKKVDEIKDRMNGKAPVA